MSLLLQVKGESKKYWMLCIISGLILWLAWPPFVFTWLIFVGFVPFFFIAEQIFQKDVRKGWLVFSSYAYFGLLIWNLLTTWWIYNASPGGSIFAITINAFLMTIPFGIFYFMRKNSSRRLGYLGFIFFWISFEYLHLNWELAWPWLNLGNVFSLFPEWVQWYEYTGALGGTLWVLLVNILIFRMLLRINEVRKNYPNWLAISTRVVPSVLAVFIFLFGPLILSGQLYYIEDTETKKIKVAVIQPNIDPYEEKFDSELAGQHATMLAEKSRRAIIQGAELVVWPETAMPDNLTLPEIQGYYSVKLIRELLEEFPHVSFVVGATTFKIYRNKHEISATAREDKRRKDIWYDVYNSALYLDRSLDYQVYHKSILVPGVERMPYPEYLGFLELFAIDMGGIAGSMGVQENPTVMKANDDLVIAPVICYESVFGANVGRFVKEGANLVVIITNDGWWGNTDGYKQHFSYASLRAIEVRRNIARAANTGISGFFDSAGNYYDATPYWKPDIRIRELYLNNAKTVYVQHGDYLGRVSAFMAILTLIAVFVTRKIKKSSK